MPQLPKLLAYGVAAISGSVACMPASASTLTDILYDAQTAHLNQPVGPLTIDAAGNVYACAYYGGTRKSLHDGAVFRLTPPAPGQTAWTPTTLYTFTYQEGANPDGISFIDGSGALYGTTNSGGSGNGTVFKLTPPTAAGQAGWTLTTLHALSAAEGDAPAGRLALDAQGNIFGAAMIGGTNQNGTIFELSPPPAGSADWAFTVLHSFVGTDGRVPNGVTLTARGTLVGSTADHGTPSDGRVFELSPPAPGQAAWTFAVLHRFAGTDGADPEGNVLEDKTGALFGTTVIGGDGYGVVFRLTPPDANHADWSYATLHSFSGRDGVNPNELVASQNGLIGTTINGGQTFNAAQHRNGYGTLYQLSPPGPGGLTWNETVLHSFTPREGSGPSFPAADVAGGFFGLTAGGAGGAHYGAVFRFTP